MNPETKPTIFLDFETYWSNDYTLSKMTTQEYILDSRFRAHGACVAVNHGAIKWMSHDVLPSILTALHKKYPDAIWVFHNSLFDATILSLIYGVNPRLIADTAGMSRAIVGAMLKSHSLDSVAQLLLAKEKGKALVKSLGVEVLEGELEREIAEYCALDVKLMRDIYYKLAPIFPTKELLVSTWVTKMMTNPLLRMDTELLERYNKQVVGRKEKLLEELQIDKKDLMSNGKFALLLDSFGVTPPRKFNAKGEEKWAFAKTDQGLKDLLEHENPDVQALVGARMEVKSTIEETRSATFARLSHLGNICVPLAYCGAVNTGRMSGRDKLNFQNLKRGGEIRRSILPPEGYAFVVSDLSQIELRFTLWLAGHHDAVKKLQEGGDLYSELASELYQVEVTKERAKEDKKFAEMRHVGKSAVLGSGYGMGAGKFQTYCASQGVKLDSTMADQAIKLFRSKYNGIPKLWRFMEAAMLKLLQDETPHVRRLNGLEVEFGYEPLFGAPGIKLPNDLWLKYPKLRIQDKQWSYETGTGTTSIFGGHWLENLVQGIARVCMTDKALKINSLYPICMTTHDEIVAVVKDKDVGSKKEWIHEQMTAPCSWLPDMPVGAETNAGYRYGDIK